VLSFAGSGHEIVVREELTKGVAYSRTSATTNVGADKDSEKGFMAF
jgi:hypothetical protein